MATTHHLKSWPEYFGPISRGERTHELRRNDRNYGVGDSIILMEFDPRIEAYTGNRCTVTITSMTSAACPCAVSHEALAPAFCILSVQVPSEFRVEVRNSSLATSAQRS
jgi:hypothetical protein